ncbi:MAG: hypothetical protein KTR22_02510 [Flavobacteriaceae bacterium]|nr:hypothetical protein [Flavobacteriaceae bacterium]
MKRFVLLLSILALGCKSKPTLHYTVSHSTDGEHPALAVHMEFEADPSGETILLYKDQAWGEENLHATVKEFSAVEASEIIMEKDSNRIRLIHPNGLKTLQVSYKIKQDTEEPLTTRKTYRPIVQDEYFHVFFHSLFMLPQHYVPESNTPFDVVINWEGFSEDQSLINSFDTGNRHQFLENTNEQYFCNAVFTGGDYRAHSMDIQHNKAVLGIRGNWEVFQDSTLVTILHETLEAQRDFWKDHSQAYFAVTMTPTIQERGSSFQGTGLTDSFSTSASNNEYLDLLGIVYLFNHELQHNWIGHVIKNDNEEEQYWFSEGFTDYYTIKNIAKHRIYDQDEGYFIKEFNEMLKALYASPVREAPNAEINYENYWSNPDYSKLPYRRGAVFAFYLDQQIQQDSHGALSLDDLMLALKEDAVKNDQYITHTYFLEKANEFLNQDLTPFFTAHIIEGGLFDFKSIFEGLDYAVSPAAEVFDLGFTFSEDQLYIDTIDESSNAYAVGLRKGDRITFRGYYYNRPDLKAEFRVIQGNQEIPFEYYPVKKIPLPLLLDTPENRNRLAFN